MVHWLYTEGYIEFSTKQVPSGLVLTEKGRKASTSWHRLSNPTDTEERWEMLIARKKLVAITGIANEFGDQLKRVEYTYVYVPASMGEELFKVDKIPGTIGLATPVDVVGVDPKQTYKSVARFKLYDDGWRVEP